MMKAMILPQFGAPLRLATVPVPKIGPNDVLLRVRATGVGLTVVIMTAVPGRVTSFPRIPGHEVAGDVVEIGSEVAHVGVGDRVTCHFYLTCGVCRFCRSGRETLCPASPGNVGMASDGAYAEYMAIPARNVTPIPQGVSDVDAAIAADAIATPYHACREEARVGPGDSVLIVGAGGGVGIHAVKLAVHGSDAHGERPRRSHRHDVRIDGRELRRGCESGVALVQRGGSGSTAAGPNLQSDG